MGQHEEVDGFLIRCDMVVRAYSSAWGFYDDYCTTTVTNAAHICVWQYKIVSRTTKGVWIYDPINSKKRFVLNNAEKRFAYPTYALALNSLRIRLRHELAYRQRRVRAIQAVLAADSNTLLNDITNNQDARVVFDNTNG